MPVTTAAEAPPLKKFHSNNILSELFRIAGEAGDSTKVAAMKEAICKTVPMSSVMLGRIINNTNQPSLSEAYAIAQVLGVSVDALCRAAD